MIQNGYTIIKEMFYLCTFALKLCFYQLGSDLYKQNYDSPVYKIDDQATNNKAENDASGCILVCPIDPSKIKIQIGWISVLDNYNTLLLKIIIYTQSNICKNNKQWHIFFLIWLYNCENKLANAV